MNISVEVTGNLLEYLDKKVQKGFYKSRSEVVREAIRWMIQRDLQEQMEAKGLTMDELEKLRGEVSGEVIKKKFGKKLKDNS
ncbi:MAG: ribbon-helix-helix protein, CopG family [Thermoplasmata archaeon]|nr:MAG: ribbon-helix-helix protein, CopG family [Thermoplasmata archaeon]